MTAAQLAAIPTSQDRTLTRRQAQDAAARWDRRSHALAAAGQFRESDDAASEAVDLRCAYQL